MGGRECIPELAEVLLNDENPIVRHEAATALGVIGRKEAEEVLKRALDDVDEVRDSNHSLE
ncbi:MAG: HEAT repeat domain-containing protein [Nitrososphaerota archaeon]